jgi:hypothetical protein
MADLRQFAGRIRVIGRRIEENADAMVRKVALAVDSAVVIATPVDTGRARSNWQVNLGGPASGTRDALDQSGQAAIAEGQTRIAQYRGGSAIHITNNLPYIGRLNDGWSAQAPSGFVEKAVLVGVAAAQGAGSLLQNALREEI